MRVFNKTKNQIVAENARVTKNIFERVIGLLFKREFDSIDALVIHPCSAVHSIGMQFSFDAVYLHKDLVVLKTFENVKPNKVLPYSLKTAYVLEVPKGTISTANIEKGDILEIID